MQNRLKLIQPGYTLHTSKTLIKVLSIALSIGMVLSCSHSNKPSQNINRSNSGPPKITRFYDISHYKAVEPQHNLKHLGDKRFSPGEMVLIKGKNLLEASVTVDDIQSNIISTDPNTLIFQIPSGLDLLAEHQLKVQNQLGTDTDVFKSSHYIIGTDTDGNRHHIMRTNPDIKGFIDEEILQINQTRPMFNSISADGAFLYTVGVQSKINEPEASPNNKYGLEIKVFHLNAPGKPAEFRTTNAYLYSAPIAIDGFDRDIAVIQGKRDFAILDMSEPSSPKQISQYKLPLNADKTVYLDALLLNQNKQLAILETYENKVLLYDISNPAKPKQTDEIKLIPEITTAYCVDLVRNKNNPAQFWVLTGKNLRDLSHRTKKLLKSILKRNDKEHINPANASLILIETQNNQLHIHNAIQLPDNVNPFFGTHDSADHIYVSAVHSDFLKTFLEEKNWIRKIRELIFKSFRFGKIFKINIQTGNTEIEAEGFGVYFHISDSQALGPVFTLSKLKGTLSAPYVSPAWGIGIKKRGTYALRKMGTRTLYPPYSLGHISIQN